MFIGMNKITITEFFKKFPDDDTCLDHLFKARYEHDHTCPKCNRKSSWYKIKSEKAYSCQWCGHHIHPMVGTIFEKSRTPLKLWFYAIYLFTTSRHGVPAKELERQLGVTYKCAWRMGHQIRKHMSLINGNPIFSGHIEADETYVGGKHKGKRGRGADGKTVVFGLAERDGQLMTKVVPNAKTKTIEPEILKKVKEGSTINTDEWHAYKGLSKKGYTHKTVDHGAKEYARGDIHVNSLEGYWARLKSSITGTHVHVSPKHLSKYTKEFEYRYNFRKNPEQMFPALISTFPVNSS